jgi:transposase
VIALPTVAEQRQRLLAISRSRIEPTGRVERARIILAYLQDPSAYAVARTVGVTQQTVTRCLERAAELGVIEALDDRPRAGRDPVITAEAKTWLVALACRKAKELGYPHELRRMQFGRSSERLTRQIEQLELRLALGRRNWLFAGSHSGGERAAAMYSISSRARYGRNGMDAGFSMAGTSFRTTAVHKSADETGQLKAISPRPIDSIEVNAQCFPRRDD